jgi:hypothetical protein
MSQNPTKRLTMGRMLVQRLCSKWLIKSWYWPALCGTFCMYKTSHSTAFQDRIPHTFSAARWFVRTWGGLQRVPFINTLIKKQLRTHKHTKAKRFKLFASLLKPEKNMNKMYLLMHLALLTLTNIPRHMLRRYKSPSSGGRLVWSSLDNP